MLLSSKSYIATILDISNYFITLKVILLYNAVNYPNTLSMLNAVLDIVSLCMVF